jgi:membrane-associated phospholipid phosphatase
MSLLLLGIPCLFGWLHKQFLLMSLVLFFATNFVAQAQNMDIDLLKSINLHRNKDLDFPCTIVSDATLPLLIVSPLLLTGIGLVSKDSTTTQKGLVIGATVVGNTLLTAGLKLLIDRPRPYITYPIIDEQTTEKDASFPSGHTSSAFALATSFALAYPKWYVIAPVYVWAGATAYSRMHLGVHYPSDVLAGAVLGSGCAMLSHYLNKKLRQKRRK